MTFLDLAGLKRLAAALLIMVLVLASPSFTRAADESGAPAPRTEAGAAKPGPTPGEETPPTDKAEAPRLQIQDEGPGADTDRLRLSRRHVATTSNEDSVEEKPFWKSWVFWTVTGALVAGAVGMLVYTASDSSVAPCPIDIAVSLGCYGAGRQ